VLVRRVGAGMGSVFRVRRPSAPGAREAPMRR
jgi:hypothetical protein